MGKMLIFGQDNGSVNRGTEFEDKKLSIAVPSESADYLIRDITGWRANKKGYNSVLERFKKSGSSTYDKVILELYRKGYAKN